MNEPKVRFKGFEGEWEEKKFTEIVNRVSQTGRAGFLPGVEFEDIVSGRGILNKNINEKPCNKIGKMFFAGDVLFGKLRPYLRNILLPNFDGVAIGDFWVLHPNGIEPKLLYEIVNTDKFMEVANVSSGSKMPRADWNFVSEAIVTIPTDKAEQRRIASYFTHLDTLIEASRQKVEKLKQVKAASLQSFFPTHGERTPKIRFKGYEGEWKVVKLGEIGYTYNGLTGKGKSDFGKGKARYITFLNVLNNAHIDTSILEQVNVSNGEKQNEVRKGDLFFNTSSETPEEVGLCAVLDEDLENVYLNSFCFGFRVTEEEVHSALIAYMMRSHIGRNIMSILAQGATRFNLSKTSFCNAEILLPPTLQEQRKIASYFTHLDTLLTLERQRYAKLQQVKRASLTQMFA